MNRCRIMGLLVTVCLVSSGCNASFWGKWGEKKADPYASVESGMTEKQVVKLLGEPSRRSGIVLEGDGPRATNLTWVGHSRLIVVTMVEGKVRNKQRF